MSSAFLAIDSILSEQNRRYESKLELVLLARDEQQRETDNVQSFLTQLYKGSDRAKLDPGWIKAEQSLQSAQSEVNEIYSKMYAEGIFFEPLNSVLEPLNLDWIQDVVPLLTDVTRNGCEIAGNLSKDGVRKLQTMIANQSSSEMNRLKRLLEQSLEYDEPIICNFCNQK